MPWWSIENDESTNTTEMQYRTFTAGAWSAGTNFGSFANKDTRAITLSSNPYSDQIQLLVNDDDKILRSDLWTGSSFAAPIQLESNTGTTDGQPFSFFWDRHLPGTVTTSTTFTQTAAMAAPFVMPAGGAVKVTTYIQLTSGTLPAAPKLAVTLGQAGECDRDHSGAADGDAAGRRLLQARVDRNGSEQRDRPDGRADQR